MVDANACYAYRVGIIITVNRHHHEWWKASEQPLSLFAQGMELWQELARGIGS